MKVDVWYRTKTIEAAHAETGIETQNQEPPHERPLTAPAPQTAVTVRSLSVHRRQQRSRQKSPAVRSPPRLPHHFGRQARPHQRPQVGRRELSVVGVSHSVATEARTSFPRARTAPGHRPWAESELDSRGMHRYPSLHVPFPSYEADKRQPRRKNTRTRRGRPRKKSSEPSQSVHSSIHDAVLMSRYARTRLLRPSPLKNQFVDACVSSSAVNEEAVSVSVPETSSREDALREEDVRKLNGLHGRATMTLPEHMVRWEEESKYKLHRPHHQSRSWQEWDANVDTTDPSLASGNRLQLALKDVVGKAEVFVQRRLSVSLPAAVSADAHTETEAVLGSRNDVVHVMTESEEESNRQALTPFQRLMLSNPHTDFLYPEDRAVHVQMASPNAAMASQLAEQRRAAVLHQEDGDAGVRSDLRDVQDITSAMDALEGKKGNSLSSVSAAMHFLDRLRHKRRVRKEVERTNMRQYDYVGPDEKDMEAERRAVLAELSAVRNARLLRLRDHGVDAGVLIGGLVVPQDQAQAQAGAEERTGQAQGDKELLAEADLDQQTSFLQQESLQSMGMDPSAYHNRAQRLGHAQRQLPQLKQRL